LILIPPNGAGPLIVTVAVAGAPPVTEVGLMLTPESAAGLTVRVAEAEPAERLAVICAPTWTATG